jgi:hypothetical protein
MESTLKHILDAIGKLFVCRNAEDQALMPDLFFQRNCRHLLRAFLGCCNESDVINESLLDIEWQ